jgi:hypothetical protein
MTSHDADKQFPVTEKLWNFFQIAGITALIKAVRGKDLQALKLKNILSTTAQQVPAGSGQNDIQSVFELAHFLFSVSPR